MTKRKRKEFTSKEIAELCGINFNIITKWINRGRLNFPWRIDQQVSIDDFIFFISQNDFKSRSVLSKSTPTVLIIDDDSNIMTSIGRVFHAKGFRILSADNGFKAGLLINQERPQIITLDLNMEKMDGYDIIKIVKELHLDKKVWIVVISGESGDNLEKSIELGADCFLKKPFSKYDLEKLINKFYPDQTIGENNERSNLRRAI